MYKSGQIHTGPGQAPNSISKQTPKGKSIPGKKITSGKLLKKSEGGKLSQAAARRPIPQAQPLPGQATTATRAPATVAERIVPEPVARAQPRPQPQAVPAMAKTNGIPSHTRDTSSGSARAPPPPPPPPAAAPPADPQFKALYDFPGETQSELSLKAGEVIYVTQKENNGRSSSFLIHSNFHANESLRLVARQASRRLCIRLDTCRLPRRSEGCTSAPAAGCLPSTTSSCARGSENERHGEWLGGESQAHTPCTPCQTSC